MASACGGNGLASVLLARSQKPHPHQKSALRKSSGAQPPCCRPYLMNLQTAGRARAVGGGQFVPKLVAESILKQRKREFGGGWYGHRTTVKLAEAYPAEVSCHKHKLRISKSVVAHPYGQDERRRKPHRFPVSCDAAARGPSSVDAREIMVNVVDKEMVLKPRVEGTASVVELAEPKEAAAGDGEPSYIQRGEGLVALQETSDHERSAVLANAETLESLPFARKEIDEENGSRSYVKSPESQLWQLEDGTFVRNHTGHKAQGSYPISHSLVEEKDHQISCPPAQSESALAGSALELEKQGTEDGLHMVESYHQEAVVMDSSVLHPNNSYLGVKGGHVTKFQKQRNFPLQKKRATLLSRIMDISTKDTEAVKGWVTKMLNKTGVDKIIAKDKEVIQEGFSWMKQVALPDFKREVNEIAALRILEDSTAAPRPPPQWPQPRYPGLFAKEVLAADVETLGSYVEYIQEVLGAWRVPLQLSYNPDFVASYFNRRPHLLVFRFLEVSAAFSSVGVQLLAAKLSRTKTGLVDTEENYQRSIQIAETLKSVLMNLGPTFIKVAQSLSSRPDLIGTETAKVLSELQDRLPPFPTKDAMAVIETELGVPVNQVFSYLSEVPVAAASFGQVYKGCTVDGEEVAVKVQRPGLLFTVAQDIYILRLGLGVVRKLAKMNSDLSVLADELGCGLFGELDYTLEAANGREFEAAHAGLQYVKVPKVLSHLTRQKVLTMEWIDGDRPTDLQLITKGYSTDGEIVTPNQQSEAKSKLDSLVKKGVQCSLVQLLETGLLHADPHPGNLLYTREGKLTYLDFGLITRVEKRHQEAMLAAIAHLVNGEWQCLANDLGDMDVLKPTIDRFALRLALERVFADGPDAVVRNGVPDIAFRQVTGKLWQIALKFRFRLPPYFTLILRSLASLEGIALSVDPNYKVFSAAYPYVVRRLLSDNSRSTRQVLKSLVLTQQKEFRWDRITSIVATSQRATSEKLRVNGDASSQSTKEGSSNDLAVSLFSLTLSKEGKAVRRLLLEAEPNSLANVFVSISASSLRRKMAFVLADALYRSSITFLNGEPQCSTSSISRSSLDISSTGVGQAKTAMEVTGSNSSQKLLPGTANISPEKLLGNRRFRFLLKALAGRLKGPPVLILRVGWTLMTMVGYATAIAFHRVMVAFSNEWLSSESQKKPNRTIQKLTKADTNSQWQPDLPLTQPV